MFIFAAALLCTILPSNVAFTSLVSAGGVPTIAAYGLIGLLRLTITPHNFSSTKFRLGPFKLPFYAATAFFNAIVFSVMISPFFFPVDAQSFNFVSLALGHCPTSHVSFTGGRHICCGDNLCHFHVVGHSRGAMAETRDRAAGPTSSR